MILFVTSADSATYVLGMLSINADNYPGGWVKVSWGMVFTLFSRMMLLTGGTQAIQNLLIIVVFPFSFVMIFMIGSLFKALAAERPRLSKRK